MSANPLNQFVIKKIYDISIFGYDVSLTNSSLFMLIAVFIVMCGFELAFRNATNIPSRKQAFIEIIYNMILNMVDSNIGKNGKRFLPLILSIFLFILSCNLLGMIPYGFTVTSHLIITFSISLLIFCVITAYGFYLNGLKFLSLFLPRGTPTFLMPLMLLIEVFSFLSRPISLSLRLCANMVAGHILLKVIAGFIVVGTLFVKPLPIPFVVVLIGFEIFVAILQAYIFAILSCVYLNDAVNLH